MNRPTPLRYALLPLAIACAFPAAAEDSTTLGQVVVTAPAMEAPLPVR